MKKSRGTTHVTVAGGAGGASLVGVPGCPVSDNGGYGYLSHSTYVPCFQCVTDIEAPGCRNVADFRPVLCLKFE